MKRRDFLKASAAFAGATAGGFSCVEGEYLGFFPPGTPSDRMVEIIRQHFPQH